MRRKMKIITDINEANVLLQSYNSAKLEIMFYSPTLGRLALRLTLPEVEKVVYIVGIGCESIYGSFRVKNSSLKIEQQPNEFDEIISTLIDKSNQFKLITSSGFGVVVGTESEFGTSFENFILGDIEE